MEKLSYNLIVDDQKEFANLLPDLKINDEALPEFRVGIVDMLRGFFPEQKTHGERVFLGEDVSLLIYKPSQQQNNTKLPVIYYIHGGGYISGNADMYSFRHQERADKLDVIVVAIEYRLAPEFPFPTPLQDCLKGLEWLYESLKLLGADKDRITIMGESAGGGLAASLNLYIKDKTEYRPKNQILIYPMIDYKTSLDPENYPNKYVGEYLWTHHLNQYAWKALQGSFDIPEDQLGYFSPSYAKDLTGLPPTYMMVGSLDLFFEEDMQYAIGLVRSGVPVTLDLVQGVIHAFYMVLTESSSEYNDRLHSVLQKVI